jgi:hypothetical protein
MATKKRFPLNYPLDVLNVINAMAFDTSAVSIAGSMSLRTQLYAGDYDMYEIVKLEGASMAAAAANAAHGLQSAVRQLLALPNCYVGDIKAGVVPEWQVIMGDVMNGRVVGFDSDIAGRRVTDLVRGGVMSREEGREALALLKPSPTVFEWLQMAKEIRPHVVRWTVSEVLAGDKMLADGRRFTLQDAVQSPAIVKLDAVSLVQGSRFTDFSIIYAFRWHGKPVNDFKMDMEHELKKDIAFLAGNGDYYKLAKRLFSLLKQRKGTGKILSDLTDMFNSDLGRLYSIISEFLMENAESLPLDKIRFELDQIRGRLGLIVDLAGVDTPAVLTMLLKMLSIPDTADGRARLLADVERLGEKFTETLNTEAAKRLTAMKLLPVARQFLP